MPKITTGFGIALILQGLGGYFGSGRTSKTALIPALPGVLLALLGLVGGRAGLRGPAMHSALVVGLLGMVAAFGGSRKGGNPKAAAARALMASTCATYVALGTRSYIAGRCAGARHSEEATPTTL